MASAPRILAKEGEPTVMIECGSMGESRAGTPWLCGDTSTGLLEPDGAISLDESSE